MQDLFKIVVYLLQHLLHNQRPLFGRLTRIEISLTDGIRKCYLTWDIVKGVHFNE